jgi:hypothetical protein
VTLSMWPDQNDHSGTWQVVRDVSGYYRAMPVSSLLSVNDISVQRGLTYREACKISGELYDVEQVMNS